MAYKEYMKKWREENKEHIKEYEKKYRTENKESRKDKRKVYISQNKEKIKECKNIWSQTEQGKKSNRIACWKQMGLISEDYDKIYELYVNTWECDNCGIELIEGFCGSNHRCMDHNHRTGLFRNILCNTCNQMRPDYESD